LAGVANSVQQVQELEQATRSWFISINERQEEHDAVNARQDAINASVLQMVASRSTDGMDDNATAFSAMTASSAVKDKRIEDLELQLRRANSSSNTGPPPTGSTSEASSFPWRGSSGGGCYVSQTMGETNPNNLVISVLDIGKGCYSLP
jgi:hypothetical protein